MKSTTTPTTEKIVGVVQPRLVRHSCGRCGEPDKCLIMGRCLREDERKAYFAKYGRWPNDPSLQSLPNAERIHGGAGLTNKPETPTPLDGASCYALFSGHRYYPDGGAEDFRAWGTIKELKELYANNADKWSLDAAGSYADPWGQIAERETMTVIMTVRGHGDWSDYSQHNAEPIRPGVDSETN